MKELATFSWLLDLRGALMKRTPAARADSAGGRGGGGQRCASFHVHLHSAEGPPTNFIRYVAHGRDVQSS